MDHRPIGRVGGLIALAALVAALLVPVAALGSVDKVTICHAAGLQGTDQFVTLELPPQAVYGNGGHFHDNGTPRAGHEGDHLGPCTGEPADPTESADTTTGPDESETTTTTTMAEGEESTSTTEAGDPPDEGVGSVVETTSTTLSGEPTTVVVDTSAADTGSGEAPREIGSTSERAPGETAAHETTGDGAASDTLPYTGSSTALVYPASLFFLVGVIAVFVTRGFGPGSGAHVAVDREQFDLGLHRGRHESTRRWG